LNPNEEAAEGTPAPTPLVAKMIRKRKLLTADSEIEISKKEYSQHLKDTSNIIKKVRPRPASVLLLREDFCHLTGINADCSNVFYLVMLLL
jgi:hypothetical protein